jgi:hypothetical protein
MHQISYVFRIVFLLFELLIYALSTRTNKYVANDYNTDHKYK